MAPRGRPRKVGLRRMDAAIDALTPMGFPPDIIRTKVKNLLRLYDGDQGWVFIEEAAYKLLIESILEEQEGVQCEQGQPSCWDSPNDDQPQYGDETEPPEVRASNEAGEPFCSDQELALATPITVSPLTSSVPVLTPIFPPVENGVTWSHEPTFYPVENVIALSNEVNQMDDILREQIGILSEKCKLSGPPGFEHSLQMQLVRVPGKRKPCLGWLGPKDDEDYILLKPAPVQDRRPGEERRKRKSRWDVGPDGVV